MTDPKPCRHLLAPLVPIPPILEDMDLGRYRICAACDARLWENGRPMEYGPDESKVSA